MNEDTCVLLCGPKNSKGCPLLVNASYTLWVQTKHKKSWNDIKCKTASLPLLSLICKQLKLMCKTSKNISCCSTITTTHCFVISNHTETYNISLHVVISVQSSTDSANPVKICTSYNGYQVRNVSLSDSQHRSLCLLCFFPLWNTQHQPQSVNKAMNKSLE